MPDGGFDYQDKAPRKVTKYEEDCVNETMQEFSQMHTWRSTTASHWEEIAELIDPVSRNTFFYQNFNWPGQKKTDRQVDASGMMALSRFGAICDSLLTPRNMYWHGLAPNNEYLKKQRGVMVYFEQVRNILFKYRYSPYANFSAHNQGIFKHIGAYGTGGMFVDELDGKMFGGARGLRYKSVPIGELFIRENHQGVPDGFIRWFRMTAEQIYQKWPVTFPETLMPSLQQKNQGMIFNILHRVCPRSDYDPERLDHKGKPWASYYVSIEGRSLLDEGGYRTFPLPITRYDQTPGEVYGRSPAMLVLPALKTLNAEKRTFLKQGHRAADPVLLTADDGITDLSMRPGALNKGGVTADGKLLVQTLPVGNIQINEKMMAEEKSLINDAFFVTLFQILQETPQMTATEVIERVNEKGILLAPTIGRQQSEYLGQLIPRELDVLSYIGVLPAQPPVLKEAKGEYEIVYTSPLSRAMRAQEAAGFMRTLENVKELVAITGDQSLLDPFNFRTAIPAIADIQAVPPSWMATKLEMAAKAKNRAQAMQEQQRIQALPSEAAMVKAQAVAAKSGAGQQQQQPTMQPQQQQPQGPGQ